MAERISVHLYLLPTDLSSMTAELAQDNGIASAYPLYNPWARAL
jgi:hypothetical protein